MLLPAQALALAANPRRIGMRKALVYGTLGLGALSATSICDLCQPSVTSALLIPRVAYAASATVPAASAQTTAAHAVPVGAVTEQPRTVRLKVAGMTCGGCVIGTRRVLTRLPGVTKADVSYEKGEAVVTYNPAKVTVAQMVAAVKTLGYSATPVAG